MGRLGAEDVLGDVVGSGTFAQSYFAVHTRKQELMTKVLQE